jgi:hypothetical protein
MRVAPALLGGFTLGTQLLHRWILSKSKGPSELRNRDLYILNWVKNIGCSVGTKTNYFLKAPLCNGEM